MTVRKPHIRMLSRLLAGVFALQLVVGGFCLMTAEAHAMPMQEGASVMTHCSDNNMPMDHGISGHASDNSACTHCSAPDAWLGTSFDGIAKIDMLLLGVLPEQTSLSVAAPVHEPVATSCAQAPPRSSSLIFTTTQRIRI